MALARDITILALAAEGKTDVEIACALQVEWSIVARVLRQSAAAEAREQVQGEPRARPPQGLETAAAQPASEE